MQNSSMKRSALLVAGALTLAGAFFAGAAYAADPKLDAATALITQAVTQLKGAENPDPKREFGGHRRAAIELLMRAQGEILKAKQVADTPSTPKPRDPKEPKPRDPKEPKPREPQQPIPKEPQQPTPKG